MILDAYYIGKGFVRILESKGFSERFEQLPKVPKDIKVKDKIKIKWPELEIVKEK